MNVVLSPRAKKQLRKLSKVDQIAIIQKIQCIQQTTIAIQQEKKLSGYTNIYRIRVGNYRIVYKKSTTQLYIVLIRHRKDVYRIIKEILG